MNVRPNSKIVELKLHAYIFARNVNIIEKLKFRKIQLHSNEKIALIFNRVLLQQNINTFKVNIHGPQSYIWRT